ncbi:MAG: DMT family transporter [Candidatus Anaerobiospirillum merdipullorum]|uniref:DMT family transporter n=1 Tax=Candidatus Anaerobiospirillum merdipullorum TaxID=2838450 RepID=A0A9E2KM93_9GAMM|nr:DMT family transporter [Candidatus Anaerobiospirillum merdipullorum]
MHKVAPLFILLAGTLWGMQGIYTRQFNAAGLTSFDIAAIRICGTGLIALVALLILRPRLLKIKLHDLWVFLGSGLISIASFTCLYYTAIELTSLGTAAVLMYIAPAVVTLLSRLIFHEEITLLKGFALFCAMLGCVFVSGGGGSLGHGTDTLGLLCGLGSGFAYAFYTIFGAIAMHRGYSPVTLVAWTFIIGSVGVLPLCSPQRVYEISSGALQLVLLEILFIIAGALLPYCLYSLGLKYMQAGKASILAAIEAVAAAICGLVFFGEPLTINLLIGIGAIILSVICLNLKRSRVVAAPMQGKPSSTADSEINGSLAIRQLKVRQRKLFEEAAALADIMPEDSSEVNPSHSQEDTTKKRE